MIDPGLDGKVVLVTGGNNPFGIGAATAKAFARQGSVVFIHYYRPSLDLHEFDNDQTPPPTPGLLFYLAQQTKTAEEVVEAIHKEGGQAASWECDLTDPDTIPTLFDRAEKAFGQVDIVVNNAADYMADSFLPSELLEQGNAALWEQGPATSTLSSRSYDRHFAVNTRAVALMMAEFARRHINKHKRSLGSIVNVSADCSWGCPGEISYRASKHALESYSRSAAAELGPYGININIVSPGPVQSGYISPDVEEQLIEEIPLRRIGLPEDIADVIVFLASDQARWITGQLITVHGGHRMSLGR